MLNWTNFLIPWHYLVHICLRPLLPFYSQPHFFGNEGAKVVHMSCKFHLHLTCNFQVFIFKIFLYQQKVPIQAFSRCFFGYNPQKCGQIGLKFQPHALLHLMSYTPIFCQIKHLMELHNCSKSYQCGVSDCQVINFQMFSC